MAALTNIGPQMETIWEARNEEGAVEGESHLIHK